MRRILMVGLLLAAGTALAVEDMTEAEWEAKEREETILDMQTWMDDLKAEIAELETDKGDAPAAVQAAANTIVGLRREQISVLEKKLAAVKAEDSKTARAAERDLEELEFKLALADLEMEEAWQLCELEEMATDKGLDNWDAFAKQVKDLYAQRREVCRQLYELTKKQTELERMSGLLMKQLQVKMLEAEIEELKR